MSDPTRVFCASDSLSLHVFIFVAVSCFDKFNKCHITLFTLYMAFLPKKDVIELQHNIDIQKNTFCNHIFYEILQ